MAKAKPWTSTHDPKHTRNRHNRVYRATIADRTHPSTVSTVLIHGDTMDRIFEDGYESPALYVRNFCKDQGFGIVNYGYDGEYVAYQFRDSQTANRFRFAFPYPTKYRKPE